MAQERILIVDDDVQVGQVLCRVLSQPGNGGYLAENCDSAQIALGMLAKNKYDLLITDLQMPGMNGLELLEQAYQINPRMRTILMTAYTSPDIEARAKRRANAYVPKPFALQSFVQTIRQTMMLVSQSATIDHFFGRRIASDSSAH